MTVTIKSCSINFVCVQCYCNWARLLRRIPQTRTSPFTSCLNIFLAPLLFWKTIRTVPKFMWIVCQMCGKFSIFSEHQSTSWDLRATEKWPFPVKNTYRCRKHAMRSPKSCDSLPHNLALNEKQTIQTDVEKHNRTKRKYNATDKL